MSKPKGKSEKKSDGNSEEQEIESSGEKKAIKLTIPNPFTFKYYRIIHLLTLAVQAFAYFILIIIVVTQKVEVFYAASGMVFTAIFIIFWVLRGFHMNLRKRAWFLANTVSFEVIYNTAAIVLALILLVIHIVNPLFLLIVGYAFVVAANSFAVLKLAKVMYVQSGTSEERAAVYGRLVGSTGDYIEFIGVEQPYYVCLIPHEEKGNNDDE